MRKPIIDLTGSKKGKLTVLKLLVRGDCSVKDRKMRGNLWLVRCDCGNKKVLNSMQIGVTASCGCLVRLSFGESSKKKAYTLAMRCAASSPRRSRPVSWALSLQQFVAIASRPCTYCGLEWSKEIGKPRNGKSIAYGTFKYNSLDRIDSTKGYILGNCTAACVRCNDAKNNQTQEEFRNWLQRTYAHYVLKTALPKSIQRRYHALPR